MKRFLSKYWKTGLTLALGLAVFFFWWSCYPFALTYQEQFQLFLFDSGYLWERLSEPGGVARYIAEFLVQFYNGVAIGAAILAVLFMLLQRLTWRLMRPVGDGWYALSFLPVLLLWYAMGDENVMLTYHVALIMVMAAALGWRSLAKSHQAVRWAVLAVAMPLLYWLAGPLCIMAGLLMAPAPMALAAVVYATALILGSAWILPYPMLRLVCGMGYYRFPVTLPYLLMAIPVLIALLSYAGRIRNSLASRISVDGSRQRLLSVGGCMAVAVVGCLLVPSGYEVRKYELIEYDYLVRISDWKGIIAKAEQKTPDLPFSVAANNLALAMNNQLGERALDFYQHGSEGLVPEFSRNYLMGLLAGEIYFRLGLVNTAQRFAFEAMESLPNYAKSGRVVKRLAETNLVNGEYAVARKYLQMLEKTVFYRPWAQRTTALLGNEEAINRHPLYGTLRQFRLGDDFLFSEQEIDKICGQLFMHNHQNAMAMQYLVMSPLLDGDAERFLAYIGYVQSEVNYNPRYVREAIAKIRRVR